MEVLKVLLKERDVLITLCYTFISCTWIVLNYYEYICERYFYGIALYNIKLKLKYYNSFWILPEKFSVQNEGPEGGVCPLAQNHPCGKTNCTDNVCPDTGLDVKLCCQDQCGEITCADPTYSTRAGTCPSINNASNTDCRTKWSCSRDQQCGGTKKCCAVSEVCKMCVDPSQ